ncbi:hypothetical protein SAMN05421666_1326 [Roseovarius nanhaiticus]|uniref:Uncharacterized protein n=1 Tax=Roseovarius nanhaiticus TaxID=573024 RepID=A0A1N7FSI1_9RHOB|nr:hypothetical protein SAMN05216208_0810 [Roseovarius nanhaiticus]SIS03234.1 hypothetical protein SAMN05421666_1326 [Roseovarius nanhaiticus]
MRPRPGLERQGHAGPSPQGLVPARFASGAVPIMALPSEMPQPDIMGAAL